MPDTFYVNELGDASCDELSTILRLAFHRALRAESEISPACLKLRGMSGVRYRMCINNLIRLAYKPRYLEVGSWAGSTACSAMDQNALSVLCIDNWSQFGGPKDDFFKNIAAFRTDKVIFSFIEEDFRKANPSTHGRFNIYLFDGPHEEADQYDGLHLYQDALDNDFIFIVDDWNWPFVRNGTLKAIRDTGFHIDYAIEVRTTLDDEHAAVHGEFGDWHNGYYMAKLSRIQPYY